MPRQRKSSSSKKSARGSRIDPYREFVGVRTDSEVAAMAGVSSSAVHQYRNRMGIAPALPQGTTRRSMDRRKAKDASPAKRGKAALSDKEIDEVILLHVNDLGRLPDRTFATQKGVPVEAVVKARERLGIGEFEEPAKEAAPRRKGRSKLDPFREYIGVLSDSEVAKRAGLTRSAVQMYRRNHNIPAASPPGGRAAQPRAPARDAAIAPKSVASQADVTSASGKRYAWLVRYETPSGEQKRVAVAADAASACAVAGTIGDVVGVERLAEALS